MKPKYLIIIIGPTGIGKTNVAIRLAKDLKTEIVSCDSRQFFKEMNIGTAVPTPNELAIVKHHLIHSHSIHSSYNVYEFEQDAISIINTLHKEHDVVVMTGGSMLYVDAICNGIDSMPDAKPEIREQLKQQFANEGLQPLLNELELLDPIYFEQVDKMNHKRVIHGLEMCLTLGKPFSSVRTKTKKERPFNIIKIGLNMERTKLYERINKRVDLMIEQGLVGEAKNLASFSHLNALNTVGYKELFAFFNNEHSLERAIELIKRNTRHYAKKQLTWFRKDEQCKWFTPSEYENIYQFAKTTCS